MIVYLDTSTVLRIVLAQPNPLASWGEWGRAYTSEILGVEARRTLDRLRLESALDDEGIAKAQEELMKIEAHLGRIPVTRPVLRRAAQPMATVVKTLDAIYIASALMLDGGDLGVLPPPGELEVEETIPDLHLELEAVGEEEPARGPEGVVVLEHLPPLEEDAARSSAARKRPLACSGQVRSPRSIEDHRADEGDGSVRSPATVHTRRGRNRRSE